MKRIALLLLLLIPYIAGYGQYGTVSFYLVSSPDQWQLFMGANAYNDITGTDSNGMATKVVFIYTTAGDETCDSACANKLNYLTRQQGAQNGVEFCADKPGSHTQWTCDTPMIQRHGLLRYTYKNTVSYCLRLPDHCSGHCVFGENLQLLHDGNVASITAVDTSTTYSGWNDLVTSIGQILTAEAGTISAVTLNMADTDTHFNSGDDPDRMYTGMIGFAAAEVLTHVTFQLFQDCAIAPLPANIDDMSIANKAALLSQLDYVRTSNGLPSAWTTQNVDYLGKIYFRTVIK